MTVLSATPRNQYTATAAQTIFQYTFEIFDKDDVVVMQNTTTLSEGTNYTVSGVGNDNGGNITLLVGATAGDIITIYRDMDLERLVDYQNSGDFLSSTVNDDFDRLWLALQQNESNFSRGIRPTIDDSVLNSSNTELANVTTRSGKSLGFAADGTIDYLSGSFPVGTLREAATTSAMTSISGVAVGDVIITKEFSAGNGGGAIYDAVLTSTVTPNGMNIIQGVADITISFVLRIEETANVRQFGAKGDGINDDTSFIQGAIDTKDIIYIPKGTYLVTSTISIVRDRMVICGDSSQTRIKFEPTANSSCFYIEKTDLSVAFQHKISGLTFFSSDVTYTKTAIEIIDVSLCVFDDLQTISPHWFGAGSRFLHIKGRDGTGISNLKVEADQCIKISPIPAGHSGGFIGLDHFNFHNCVLNSSETSTFPLVRIDDDVPITQVSFTGHQAWVDGSGGLYWEDTTSTGVSNGLILNNVRYEQANNITDFFVRITHGNKAQNISFNDCQFGDCNGIFLTDVQDVSFNNVYYTATQAALTIDSTCVRLSFNNCFWQTGSTASTTGVRVMYEEPNQASMPLPSTGFMDVDNTTFDSNEFNSTMHGTNITLADLAVTSLGTSGQVGIVQVITSDKVMATYQLNGTLNTVNELHDTAGFFSPTKGVGQYNIYWDAGNSRYELENNRGSTKTVSVVRIGSGNSI